MSRRRDHKLTMPSRDAGVALIIALAVLALLLVMLIGFLASSILEHRIAYNQSGQVAARIAARSALARAKVQLSTYSDLAWFISQDNMQPLVSVNGELQTSTQEDSAYPELAELLKKYLASPELSGDDPYETLKNWFPKVNSKKDDDEAAAHEDYYPQWINLTATTNGTTRLTGRFAYAIIPNLGINPSLFGNGSKDRVGGTAFDELPLSGLDFLTSAGQTIVKNPYNTGANFVDWMSLDLLSGGRGLWNDNYFYKTGMLPEAPDEAEFVTRKVTNRELVNAYFTVDSQRFPEYGSANDNWRPGSEESDARINLKQAISLGDAQTLLSHIIADEDVRNQVAANLKDYTDNDDNPTSNVAPGQRTDGGPSEWEKTTYELKYTGNELTPYINQILPRIDVVMTYTVAKTQTSVDPAPKVYKVTQTVAVQCKGSAGVELINIYPENFEEQNRNLVTIKNLKIKPTISVTAETGSSETLLGSKKESLDRSSLDVDFKDTPVSKRSYAKVESSVYTTSKDFGSFSKETTGLGPDDPIPSLEVSVKVTDVSFDRAVLLWDEGWDSDYVKSLKHVDAPSCSVKTWGLKLISDESGNPINVPTKVSDLADGITTPDPETKTVYMGWEVADPRCNLNADQWTFKDPDTDLTKFNWGSRNSSSDAENGDPTEPKDLEQDKDPVKLSTAYIRNGAMGAPWELALIHRGAPWQTINLRSALDPLSSSYEEHSYFNDGILWDKIKFTVNSNDYKFNLNLLSKYKSAFGVLTKGLKYHALNNEVFSTADGTLDKVGGMDLGDNAEEELREWIANKCHATDGSGPAATVAGAYQRYLHRGMLANVIMAWAQKGDESPFKSKLKEAHLSALIGKIAPLVRCGDTYEYFTVFAVGQAIKDFGGGNKFYKYDNDGKLINTKESAYFGKFEEGIDQITAQTYLVARIRREINDCKGDDSCKLGLHGPNCTFKLTVLESYTLDEL